MHPYEVLRRPILTEKSMLMSDDNKYVFEVDGRANKKQIKEAVEKAFDVSVAKVAVVTMQGKTRRWGRKVTKTSPWKKAIVTLVAGDTIQLFEGA
jgi:large subunit ribosomal protein L23